MNQCIITIVKKSVLVTFNQVVEKGSIEVLKTNGNHATVYKKELANTNFENMELILEKENTGLRF